MILQRERKIERELPIRDVSHECPRWIEGRIRDDISDDENELLDYLHTFFLVALKE